MMSSSRRPSRRLRHWQAALIVLALVGTAAGCGSDDDSSPSEAVSDDWDKVVEAAKKEGQVNVYSAINEENLQSIIEAFNEAYPEIKVVPNRKTSSLLAQQFAQEAQGGVRVADVLTTAAQQSTQDFCDSGDLTDLDVPAVEEYDWPDTAYNGCKALLLTSLSTIWWNTDKLTEEERPKSWQDLLDPRFGDGKMVIANPAITNSYVWPLTIAMDEFGEDFLVALGKQKPAWGENSEQGQQRVGAGEVLVAVGGSRQGGMLLKEEGLPIDGFTPDPCTGAVHTGGVATQAPHPNAARVFMNWIMSPEGQSVAAQGGASALPNVEGVDQVPECFVDEDPDRAAPNSENGLKVRELLGAP